MLKRQFSYFLLGECTRKKDRAAESVVGGVREGGGMVSNSQIEVSKSRHSQQRCLLAWPECC